MTYTDEDQRAAAGVTCGLRAQLHQHFPYMKTDVVVALVKKFDEDLQKGIVEQQQAIEATKARISFMSLSAELRNEIYWLALKPDPNDKDDQEKYRWDAGKPTIVLQTEDTDKYGWDEAVDTKWLQQPALTKVSRQVREESLSVYYGKIEFRAYGCGYVEQIFNAAKRLSQIGKHQRFIKHLCVLYDYEDLELNVKQKAIRLFNPVPASSMVRQYSVCDEPEPEPSSTYYTVWGRPELYAEI